MGYKQTEREHTELKEVIAAVDAARTDADLDAVVARLQAMLPPHFASEERAGGLFPEALARNPEAAQSIAERIREHKTLGEALAALDGAGRKDRLVALCAALGAHERHEAELLADLAYRETGSLD